ncbi:hypothetical protein Taro_047844 [Colocasia esculenta]|uniref:Uncharacterized protein n=1 Tax=Colocasia esculenta TaxID=4460 RepID=A0A843X4F0_COLES|nr:hypothetical protein [Colocasia esculenta]
MAEAQGPAPRSRQRGPPLPPPTHFSCSPSAGRRGLQSRLHNFSFPSMSWGSQRLLRCVKLEPLGGSRSPGPRSAAEADDRSKMRRMGVPPSPAAPRVRGGVQRRVDEQQGEGVEGEDGEVEPLVKFRDSVMTESQKAAQRTPLPSPLGAPPTDFEGVKEQSGLPPLASVAEVSRPWNLRLRRAACNAPEAAVAAMENVLDKAPNNPNHGALSKEREDSKAATFPGRTRSSEVRSERPKFSSMLSKDDIAEDFFVMTGSKPPRLPKKRPRNVQKQIEMLYPGFYLCEVTPELYKIPYI